MTAAAVNPLLSTGRPSDSALTVQLHPLVLLTISDYVTRHTLRNQEGPVLGAIIGQQNGREVTMEHAFECKLKAGEAVNGHDRVVMDEEWFSARLEQFKDVHKAPALDLVALFTLGPASGPLPQHVPILQQIQHSHNDALILLLFHPEIILGGHLTGGKLPISLYESYYEPGSEDADKGLQSEGWGMGTQLQMRFRELGFEVETGEAEMIGVDFVAKGGGNATAIASTGEKEDGAQARKPSVKGKGKAVNPESSGGFQDAPLSPEDEELVASLTGKANAIKMLHQRVNLIKTYLSTLPPSYFNDTNLHTSADPTDTPPNQPLLRNIASMLSRLPLLAPPAPAPNNSADTTTSSLSTAAANEHSDVHLISLLSSLTRTVGDAKEFGTKYNVVQKARSDKRMGALARGGSGGGGGAGDVLSRFGTTDDWTPEAGPPEYNMDM